MVSPEVRGFKREGLKISVLRVFISVILIVVCVLAGVFGYRIAECWQKAPSDPQGFKVRHYASRWLCKWRGIHQCGQWKPFPWAVYLVFDGLPDGKLVARSSKKDLSARVVTWGLGPNELTTRERGQRILQIETIWLLKRGIMDLQESVWLEPADGEHQGLLCPDITQSLTTLHPVK